MLEDIESILRNQCGLERDRLVVAGVSGGPDSLCLMEVLREAGYPVMVAHFNHRLRPESQAEAAHVQEIARRLDLRYVSGEADVHAHADAEGRSLEEAARRLRYAFLFEQARQHEAQAVAVGHTADDQVETVLMHFLRGAGLTGLKGMTYRTFLPSFERRIPVVRPLLDTWREETVACCAARGLQPVMDPSNASTEFMRNRLRNVLIPSLEEYNPKFRQVAWRSAQSLQLDHALLREMVEAAWGHCVKSETAGLIAFELPRFRAYPPGLQRNLLRLAVERLLPEQETSHAMLERAVAFVNASRAGSMDLGGGLSLVREEHRLYLKTPAGRLPVGQWPQMPQGVDRMAVRVPGLLEIPGGWKLASEVQALPAPAEADRNSDPFQVWLDADCLPDPLELRSRQPGDRFRPLGMRGHSQKLSDFLINERMPRRLRDRWPLLCSGENVIWVPGYRPAHPCRLQPDSRRLVYFSLRRLPD